MVNVKQTHLFLDMKNPENAETTGIFRGFIFIFLYLAVSGHFIPGRNLICKIQFENVPYIVYQQERNQH